MRCLIGHGFLDASMLVNQWVVGLPSVVHTHHSGAPWHKWPGHGREGRFCFMPGDRQTDRISQSSAATDKSQSESCPAEGLCLS